MARSKKRNTGPCLVVGCEKPAKSMNMCNTHYMQHRRGARSAEGALLRPMQEVAAGCVCKVEECDRDVIGRGFCSKHYQQWTSGYRDLDGSLLKEIKERNLGPTGLSHGVRRARGLRSGTCKLCDKPMFHGGTGYCSKHYGRYRRGQIDADGNELRSLQRVASYEGMTCKVDGCDRRPKAYGMCDTHRQQVLYGIIDADGNKLRDPEHGPPKGRDTWKGSRGYIKRRAEDHPRADKYGFVLEHRLVVEQEIGRYLDDDEIVHHIDGIRWNNSPENLRVERRTTHTFGKDVTSGFVEDAISALEHNDPDEYAQLVSKLIRKTRN